MRLSEGGIPRSVVWIASSKSDLSRLPAAVKASFGLRLFGL
jgi:phage-related protein